MTTEQVSCAFFNPLTTEMRSLFLNLKDKGNPGLRNEIVLGAVTPHKVVRMTKEVSSKVY